MKIFIPLFLLILSNYAEEITLDSDKWKLVWSDEFEGKEIDKSSWSHITKDTIGGGYGNGEAQFYTDRPQNSFIQDGRLHIKALKENYQKYKFTSAKLQTKAKVNFKYGKFSFRAKLPKGKGLWPAIWMLPENIEKYGTWPACGEIDIMELVGHKPATIHGTLHYGTPHKFTGKPYKLSKGDFTDDFHTFELIWRPGNIQWFVDGKLYQTQKDWFTSGYDEFPAPFNQKFYLILNLAVGGRWPGYPDNKTIFPATMEVDWARVYEYQGNYPEPKMPNRLKGKEVKLPYSVYSEGTDDYHFTPSGLMGNFGAMGIDLKSTDKPRSGKTCMKVTYSCPDFWSGMMYQFPKDDWGQEAGGIDLSGAKKLTFWARSAKGTRKIKFSMGLLGRNVKFYDTFKAEKEFTLTEEWKQYTLNLNPARLTHIKTPFAFAFGSDKTTFSFYLDDIRYE